MRVDIDPEGRWPADVVIDIEPLVSQPYDVAAWRRRVVERALGGAAGRVSATTTDCGWPMELVEGDYAIAALYTFGDHVAAAIARGAGHRAEVVALLRAARPDWRGPDIACLAELWEP